MDSDSSRAAKGAANTETSGWKSAEFRKMIVTKIMETVIVSAPRTVIYRISDVITFAEEIEEKVNASATDEADYVAKISRRIMSIKASCQSSAANPLPLHAFPSLEALSAPGANERVANIDWQEPLYQRVQRIRSMHFSKLTALYQHLSSKLQQCDSASQNMKATHIEKYKFVKRLLEDIFMHLNVTKSQITPDFKERLDRLEKHINSILRPKHVPADHQGPHSADVHSIQQALPSQSRVSQDKLSEKQLTLPSMCPQSSYLSNQIPHQNKMNSQVKSANSEKLMQLVAKESNSSQKYENLLSEIEGVTSKHYIENLPSSSAGNAVQLQIDGAQHSNESFLISTPGISPSPLLEDCNNLNEISHNPTVISDEPSPAIQRLVKVLPSMSPKSLSESISEIRDVVRLSDILPASFEGPKDVIGSNLVVDLSADSQAGYSNSDDFLTRETKMRRCHNAMPLYTPSIYASTTESFKPLTDAHKSDINSVTSQIKWPMIEEKCALLEEIKKVNKLLIDTEVVINEADAIPSVAAGAAEHGEGLIVKLYFRAVTVSLDPMSHSVSNQMSIIKPLWLLVPTSYPICSPILLDEMPSEFSEDPDDMSMKAKLKLQSSLRNLMHPWSVGDIAILWEKCAREAICDYAQQRGGGTFSSKYGGWETCPDIG